MKKVLVLLLVLLPIWVGAQTDLQLSQQLFSRMNYNPAATGASNYINMFLLARQQWMGFKNAPSTQVFNAHNYFENIKSGVGLTVSNDKVGLMNSINAKLAYAYHIHFDEDAYLSLGLSAGVLYKKFNASEAVLENPDDPIYKSYLNHETEFNPDFDFGIEFNMRNWQIGVSTTHLNNVTKMVKDLNLLQANRHIYAYTKYIFDVDYDWKVVPTVVAINNENTFSFEINAMGYFKERFWLGASYRFNNKGQVKTDSKTNSSFLQSESLVGIVGLFITDFLRLGYSYDFNIGPIKSYSSGSHEIMLSFRLSKGEENYGRKTPRFFE